MNPRQFAQQIKHELQRVRWDVDGGEVVFGSTTNRVAVMAGPPSAEQMPAGMPWAIVMLDGADFDEEFPTLLRQTIRVVTAAEVTGDPLGEHTVTGGPAASLAKSAGRGIAEVSERVRAAVQDLTGADGAKVLLSGTSIDAVRQLSPGHQMGLSELVLSALCTSLPHFAAPQVLRWSAGAWRWAGDHCERRYDFMRYRLVHKTGTDYSIDPTDGTVMYTGTASAWEGPQSEGVWTVFADYDARGRGTVEASSAPEVGSWRVAS